MFHVLVQAVSYSGDIVHHVQQHFQFRFQLRHYSLLPYQKLQARQLRQLEQNIQALPVLIYTFMELLAGISLAAIEQWGYSGYAVNFPISFDIVYNVLSIPQNTASTSNSYWGRFYITNLTKNGFTVSDTGAGSNRWLAIGKAQPQWGYGNSESTQTFPVKYPNAVIGIYGSKRAINYEYTFAATSITNSNFFMSTRNSEGSSRVIACNWLAIGQQQTK